MLIKTRERVIRVLGLTAAPPKKSFFVNYFDDAMNSELATGWQYRRTDRVQSSNNRQLPAVVREERQQDNKTPRKKKKWGQTGGG
jgi:hypothetical protein